MKFAKEKNRGMKFTEEKNKGMGRKFRRKRVQKRSFCRRKKAKFPIISIGAFCVLLLAAMNTESMFQIHFGRMEKGKNSQGMLRKLPVEILDCAVSIKESNQLHSAEDDTEHPAENNAVYPAENDAVHSEGGNRAYPAGRESSVWLFPQAEQCLFTESEKEELEGQALAAAEQARNVYQSAEYAKGPSRSFYIRNFTEEQRQEAAALLGAAGLVSVTADANMENYEKVEEFYRAYLEKREAMVTIFEVNLDGLIGASTFLYRDGSLQNYYVGIEWQLEYLTGRELSQGISASCSSGKKGVSQEPSTPSAKIKETSVSNISELKLTEKGYLIYAYEYVPAHASLRQCWRVKPLSDQCRELTAKYISGLSYVNYNVLVTNWDSGNAEDILKPCMFEDIYRIDTGEPLKAENGRIPAELYERIMTTYFPVSVNKVREKCGYEESTASYPYEMIYAVPYPPFGEVVDYREQGDGSIILFVDGVWADCNSDFAFRNEIAVMPFSDGTFRYLSNRAKPRDLELPAGMCYNGEK